MKDRMDCSRFLRRLAATPGLSLANAAECKDWSQRFEDSVFMAESMERTHLTLPHVLEAARRLLADPANVGKVYLPAGLLQHMVDELTAWQAVKQGAGVHG